MDYEQRILAIEKRLFDIEQLLGSTSGPNKYKKMSLRELINNLKPDTAIEIVLVIGYYYETVLSGNFFTIDNLKSGFQEAKIVAPKNISDVVAKNMKKGFIMPDKESYSRQRQLVLTNTGEKEIQRMQAHDAKN